MKPLEIACSALVILLLTSCANPVTQSEEMIRQGRVNEGLAKLEEAAHKNPDNVEYRVALFRNREAVVNDRLIRADALVAAHHLEEGESAYRDVLNLQAENARALAGLNDVAGIRRQDALLKDARKLLKDGKLEEAKSKLQAVLAESPNNPGALELRRALDESNSGVSTLTPHLAPPYQKLVSLEFRDAPLAQVFNALSMQTQLNFIFDKEVHADVRTTIFVRNVPLEEAINVLLVTNQLDKKVLNENTLLIYPNQPAKQKDYQELVIKSFYLANADAKVTLTMLKTLLKTRDMFIDEKLNLLIMRDTPEVVAMAEKLIAAQDKPEPEVMLDVEVLEVDRTRLLQLGILYPPSVTASLNSTTTSAAVAAGSTVVQTTQTNPLTLQSLRTVGAGDIGISNLAVTANLLKTDGDVKLLANPRIRVKNREKAKIHVGDRVPVITTTSSPTVGVSESVTYLDVGLKLEVEPNVYLDDDVGIKVDLEVSNIINTITNAAGTVTYQLGTREATTDLRTRNGETQILAGLINDNDTKSSSKIPGLGDLPWLGHLFSNDSDEHDKSEIVLLITPHIVRNVQVPEADTVEFSSGTESSLGAAPLEMRSGPVRAGTRSSEPESSDSTQPVRAGMRSAVPESAQPAPPPEDRDQGLTLSPDVNVPGGATSRGAIPQAPEASPLVPPGSTEVRQ